MYLNERDNMSNINADVSYVLYDTANKTYIKIGYDNGGFPYDVKTLKQSEMFDTVDQAFKYMKAFSGYSQTWLIKKIGIVDG